MSKERATEETAARSAVPGIYIDICETGGNSESSYDTQRAVSNDPDVYEGADSIELSGWLMEATVDLSQDLDTSKKELDIIKFIIDEMEPRRRSDHRPSLARQGGIELMQACREYSSSRCNLLRERLRQVQLWTHNRMLGPQVPERRRKSDGPFLRESPSPTPIPTPKWRLADVEWRKWLSSRASSRQLSGARVSPLEMTPNPSNDVAWRVWGPLPHILSADIWWKDLS
ncbi:hypothetical protein GGR55DRAFT_703093 [Xylaria sp. FL0064]|nr:hypothetical protein GGR55DRAFT_703093 [Xylaria sp. FL0064]